MHAWSHHARNGEMATPLPSARSSRSPVHIFEGIPRQSMRTAPSHSTMDTHSRTQRSRSRSRSRNPLLVETTAPPKPVLSIAAPPTDPAEYLQTLHALEAQIAAAQERFTALKAEQEDAAASVVYLTATDPRLRAMETQAAQLREERAQLEAAVARREERLRRVQASVSEQLSQASELFHDREERSVELYRQQLLFRYTGNDAEVLRCLDGHLARLERRRAARAGL